MKMFKILKNEFFQVIIMSVIAAFCAIILLTLYEHRQDLNSRTTKMCSVVVHDGPIKMDFPKVKEVYRHDHYTKLILDNDSEVIIRSGTIVIQQEVKVEK